MAADRTVKYQQDGKTFTINLPREEQMKTKVYVGTPFKPPVFVIVDERVGKEWVERARFIVDKDAAIRVNRKLEYAAIYPHGYVQMSVQGGHTEYTRKNVKEIIDSIVTAIYHETQTF